MSSNPRSARRICQPNAGSSIFRLFDGTSSVIIRLHDSCTCLLSRVHMFLQKFACTLLTLPYVSLPTTNFVIAGASSVCRFHIVAHMSLQSFSLVDVSYASLKFLWIFFVFFSAKNRVPYLGVLIIRTLLFRVLRVPCFRKPPDGPLFATL